jgi:glutamate N-acetyltransferase/amino-acid N-acetyltransferase
MADAHLLSPKGFKAAAVYAGIKTKKTPDVGLLVCDVDASAAAVFTTNKVFAAPVKIGRENIAGGKLRGIVVNSGNANACTGRQGEIDARRMCSLAAEKIGCDPGLVLPSSTGIIGHLMPMAKVERGINEAGDRLGNSLEHALQFADAILTTDLVRKAASTTVKIGRNTITLAGVCKGSGMIGPRMALPEITGGNLPPAKKSAIRSAHSPLHATMLAYLTTDAAISPAHLRQMLSSASDDSFNAVTVDDHTSTNDTAAILASGLAGRVSSAADLKKIAAALKEVCQSLAYQIAADGEGATKVVRIEVSGAKSEADAKLIARAIANSPLVKCAMHGNDPNWGRIVSAAGLCGAVFDADESALKLQGTTVFKSGRPAKFDPEAVSKKLAVAEVIVDLTCGLGTGKTTLWTCDLSKEYVTINADYHT